jgi:hypothetical protein
MSLFKTKNTFPQHININIKNVEISNIVILFTAIPVKISSRNKDHKVINPKKMYFEA